MHFIKRVYLFQWLIPKESVILLNAQVIASYGEMAKLEPDTPPSKEQQKLSALHRCRMQLVEMLVMQKNRLAQGLFATLPELGQLDNSAITALAGLAPYNWNSGQFKGQRRIFGGRSTVRTVLYMATLVATRYQPEIGAFYQRLLTVGKPKKLALTACMRKLLIFLNTLCYQKRLWQLESPRRAAIEVTT